MWSFVSAESLSPLQRPVLRAVLASRFFLGTYVAHRLFQPKHSASPGSPQPHGGRPPRRAGAKTLGPVAAHFPCDLALLGVEEHSPGTGQAQEVFKASIFPETAVNCIFASSVLETLLYISRVQHCQEPGLRAKTDVEGSRGRESTFQWPPVPVLSVPQRAPSGPVQPLQTGLGSVPCPGAESACPGLTQDLLLLAWRVQGPVNH